MGTAFGSITVTKVNDGADAVPISIVSRAYEYKLSPSGSTDEVVSIGTEDGDYFIAEDGTQLIFEENGQWSSTMPTAVPGMFLWTKTITTYSDETVMTDITVTASGRGVDHISTYYYLSTSDTELAGGDWMLTIPPYVDGRYYWTKDETFYTDGTSTSTEPGLDYILNSAEYSRTVVERTDKHFFADADGVHVTVGDNMPNNGKNIRITNDGMQVRNNTMTLAEFSDTKAQIGSQGSKNLLMTNDGISVRDGITEHAVFFSNETRIGKSEDCHVSISPERTAFYNVDGNTPTAIINNAAYSSFANETTIVSETSSTTNLNYLSNTSQSSVLDATPVDIGSSYPLVSVTVVIQGGNVIYTPTGESLGDGYWYVDVLKEKVDFDDDGTIQLQTMPITITFTKTNKTVKVDFGDMSVLDVNSQLLNEPKLEVYADYYLGDPSARYAFGINALSTGDYSFSEGKGTTASGMCSHAAGINTIASGNYSFAMGNGTKSLNAGELVIGSFNKTSPSDGEILPYSDVLFMIGNGTSDSNRSNALMVHSDGDVQTPKGLLTTLSQVFGRRAVEIYSPSGGSPSMDDVGTSWWMPPGLYYTPSATTAATITNTPYTNSGFQVLAFGFSTYQTLQIAWQNASNSYIKYRIQTSNNTFGSWYSLTRGAGDLSSYLTTTAAANTYARKDTVGTIVYKSLGSDTQIAAGSSQKNMASISCAAGIWSVTAHAAFQPGGTVGHYRAVSIGTSATNATYGSFQCGASSGSTVIQTSRHITLTSTTTLYLNVYSQDAITVNSGGTIIEAVRLR